MNDAQLKRLSKIKILVSDVDGILTDGKILVSQKTESKFFMLRMHLQHHY